jgi:hypothetical protein
MGFAPSPQADDYAQRINQNVCGRGDYTDRAGRAGSVTLTEPMLDEVLLQARELAGLD